MVAKEQEYTWSKTEVKKKVCVKTSFYSYV